MIRLIAALLMGCIVMTAQAGRPCDRRPVSAATFVSAMTLAAKTRDALDQSGAQVALLARVGQDLSKYGLRYSHLAFAWRDHPQGRWPVVHELNQCGTDQSSLFNEGLGNFFLDDVFAYEAMVVIPHAASQARIAAALASATASRMHAARYNMLAFPFSTRYQNSNQWVLETYAASADGAARFDRGAVQAWLRHAGYQPTTIRIPTGTRLGARIFSANIAFDDHPLGRRMAGQIDTVTVESVLAFVRQREPAAQQFVVK